jgi:hypothetical protein
MQDAACRPKITVSADGTGIVSHAGAVLLTQALRVTGLTPPPTTSPSPGWPWPNCRITCAAGC